MIKTTKNYRAFYEKKRGYLFEGGSRSGKSWTIIQHLLIRCITGDPVTITIGRSKLTHLKVTLLDDFKTILKTTGFWNPANFNKSEMVYNLNNSVIRFRGVTDDISLTHGLSQDIFWLNEAMDIPKDVFDQLEQRTKGYWIMDYNPIMTTHWIYDLDRRDDVLLTKSTVKDNPFAPDEVVKKIMSYEPTEENKLLGTADEYKWQVYGLGHRGDPEGLIYRWEFGDIPQEYDWRVFGLDFGYSVDPCALIEIRKNGHNLYLKEHVYQTGLSNEALAELIKPIVGDELVVGDSAEPKTIDYLFSQGINIVGADKGADSIAFGIKTVNQYRLIVDKKSSNLAMELNNYIYLRNRAGIVIAKPIDKFNHLLDAMRYGVTKMTISGKFIAF